jgi:hypothetical protein
MGCLYMFRSTFQDVNLFWTKSHGVVVTRPKPKHQLVSQQVTEPSHHLALRGGGISESGDIQTQDVSTG